MNKIRAALAALLIAIAPPAFAMVLQAGDGMGTVVTLEQGACTNKASIAHLPNVNRALAEAGLPTVKEDAMHAARVTYQGKTYEGCWVLGGQVVGVLMDDGAEGLFMGVPMQQFREAEGV